MTATVSPITWPRSQHAFAGWWAMGCWAASVVIVLALVAYGPAHILSAAGLAPISKATATNMMCNWDGQWYQTIAADGYTYSRVYHSSVVFFPAYPLAARFLSTISHLPSALSLLLVSNACLLAAFVLFDRYVRIDPSEPSVARWSLLAFAFAPCAFFFHMAYTESMLLLFAIAAMYGMRRNWPPLWIALCIGAAAATRSIGVALLAPFALHLWNRMRQSNVRHSLPRFGDLASAALWMSLACWGLLAFMAFQAWRFGDPLAFVKAQATWSVREPAPTLWAHFVQLISLEPIWTTYTPHVAGYWANGATNADPLLSLPFMNPIFFLGTAGLVVYGAVRRWLNLQELALSACLLLIPYVAQTSRQCMTSEGRFAAVVFPAYIVAGHILSRLPRAISIYVLLCSAALMGLYAALFAAGYEFI